VLHVLILIGSLIAGSASATTTFVDFEFDRSTWVAATGVVTNDPFDNDIAQNDVLDFDSGIQSVASGPQASPNHVVSGGDFQATLRTTTAAASIPGYTSIVFTFPQPVTAFGADFFSIGGSRQVSVQGTFDAGLEAFDLRALIGADGGVDQGFFGLTSSTPFSSITLIALGSIASNDAFRVDNVAFELPEPAASQPAALLALGALARRTSRWRRRVLDPPSCD